jgi:NADPH:quinone reductase-like Zn-dependent oxidoreductase
MRVMRAVRIHAYGAVDVLRYEDAPLPDPGEGEVLVRVHAAGVNPLDSKVRRGGLRERIPHRLPLILGWDVAGTVAGMAPGATGFHVGDEVFGRPDFARDGSYAEYITVRGEELARKPRSLDFVDAAAVPLTALTAWQALFQAPKPYGSAGLEPGQTVLVHAAAGGVGTIAVQLAKWRGARVIATASAQNADLVRRLGADQVVDYTTVPFEQVVRGVDVVLDTVGGETRARSWAVLRPGGVLVSIVSPAPTQEEAAVHGARAAYVFAQASSAQLREIAALADAGVVKPVVSEVLPLADAHRAHELSETRHVRGKIVLQVAPCSGMSRLRCSS